MRGSMNITIVSVGKLKEKYLKQWPTNTWNAWVATAGFQVVEVPDEKAPWEFKHQRWKQVLEKRVNYPSKIKDGDVVSMAIEGDLVSSEQLAKRWIPRLHGKSSMVFVIGGSLGLSPAVKKRAPTARGHLARITLPHQLMRLVPNWALPCIP